MLKKLLSHTAIYGLAPQITKFAGVIALPIITPHFTELDFGVTGIVTAVGGMIAVLSTLGLRVVLVNSFYKSPSQYKWAWRQVYGFLTIWNIPYTILLSLVLFFFIPHEAMSNKWLIVLLNVLPIVFLGPTSTICTTYYQLKQKPLQVGIRTMVFGVLTVILNIYFIAVLKLGYIGWFLSTCITSMLNNISYWIPLNKKLGFSPIFNYKRKTIKRFLTISLPTIPHYYSAFLVNTSDRVIMKAVNVPTGDIGLYNVAYTIGNLVNALAMAANLAAGPLMNSAYKRNDEKEARSTVFVLQIFFFAITFILAIWLKEIFDVLIRNEVLRNIYPLGIIIIMGYNYRPMYIGSVNKLLYIEKTKILLKVSFVAGLISVILNFVLIPFMGFKVAAYTTFVSLMYMGYAGFYLKEFKKVNSINYYPIIWLFVTILLTVIAVFVVELFFLAKIIISLIIVFLCLFSVKKIMNGIKAVV